MSNLVVYLLLLLSYIIVKEIKYIVFRGNFQLELSYENIASPWFFISLVITIIGSYI